MHRLFTESPPDWAQLLLSQGANIEARNLHQETPLITSAGQGNLPLVELLLQYHADIHAVDAEGNTPLHLAGFNGRVKVVELLLNNGAKTRVQNSMGFSPLHQAVRRFWEVPGETQASRAENQRQIVLLLLAHDADPNVEDLSHRTAAVLATESNNAALVPLFDARSVSSGKPATVLSPDALRLPLQQSLIDTPPLNEPEVRQHGESSAPAVEKPREADSAKSDTPVAESQPIPPSSGSETAIIPSPDTKPLETLQPSEPSDPSITAAGAPETQTESTAKLVEPPTSTSAAGHPETTPKPSFPPSPVSAHDAAGACSCRARGQRAESETRTVDPDANHATGGSPPISPTRPARRSEAGIPHTKALPDLPKQKSAHAPGLLIMLSVGWDIGMPRKSPHLHLQQIP